MEEKAVEILKLEPQIRKQNIDEIVTQVLKGKGSKEDKELIGWIANYGGLDEKTILKILVITRDKSILEICGSVGSETEKRFGKYEPRKRSYDAVEEAPEPTETNGKIEETAPPAKRLKPNLTVKEIIIDDEYNSTIRQLLLSSVSPPEAVHRIKKEFKANSEAAVAQIIFNVMREQKLYNDIYSRIASLLNYSSFEQVFTNYIPTLDECTLEKIHSAASFFAFLLSQNVIDFQVLSLLSLDANPEHFSMRIFVESILTELKLDLGSEELLAKIKENAPQLIESELNPEFFTMLKLL